MTNNQLQYWRNVETNRNNLAVETETHRSNLAREVETNRANMAKEAENYRSNKAREVELNRHNVATERLGWQQLLTNKQQFNKNLLYQNSVLQETQRSNQAREAEQRRHSMATEELTAAEQRLKDRISKRSYAVSQSQLQLDRSRLEEQHRTNVQHEGLSLLTTKEQSRANKAREAENVRSNVAKENISIYQQTLDRQRLTEQSRHNRASESLTHQNQIYNLVTNLSNVALKGVGMIMRVKS